MSCDCDFREHGFGTFSATLVYVDDVCGSWIPSANCYVSDFGEIKYPLSTVWYEYTSCQCDRCMGRCSVHKDDDSLNKSDTIQDGLEYARCRKMKKHHNSKVSRKYVCPGSRKYVRRRNHRFEKLGLPPIKCHLVSYREFSVCDHMKNSSIGWLPYVILQCMLTTEIVMAFANVFVDPIYIVRIFISLVSISFVVAFRVLMNSLCDFTWDVW